MSASFLRTSLFFALATHAAAAQTQLPDPPPGIAYLRSIEGIHEYRLDNGLELLLFPDPSQETITVNITYEVGSASEGYGETGMAHLLEHMLFMGTPRHLEVKDELDAHGCRYAATTFFDRTNFYESFHASDENLAWALDLEADRMMNSFLREADLRSEMTVVRNEFEGRENSPPAVLYKRLQACAFDWHNYGNETIGARSDIEGVPIERLRDFYRAWYRPDNALLVVAGAIEPKRTLALVADKFGPLQPPDAPMPAFYTTEPPQDGERTVTLRRVGDTQLVMVGYHIPPGSHGDSAPLEVLAQILTDSPRGRLHRALVESGLATGIFGGANRLRHASLLVLAVQLAAEGSLDAVRDSLLQVSESFPAAPPTEEEVERAKGSLERSWKSTFRNSAQMAVELSEWAAIGDWRLAFLHRDRLRRVTPEEVRRTAAYYLRETNRTVARFIPSAAPEHVEIPPAPDLDSLLAGYVGGRALALGEAFDPSPRAIEARVLRSTLDSGLALALLPKKTRGEQVSVHLRLYLGSEQSLRGKAAAGELTAAMLMRGTAHRSRQEIADEIDRLAARIRVEGDPGSVRASIDVERPNLADALRLVAEILREPAFDEAELAALKRERLVEIEDSRHEPWARVDQALKRHTVPRPPDHVDYTPTLEESLERVRGAELQDLRDFHRSFYGACAAQLAVVGDFDPRQVEALIEDAFGDWDCATPHQRIPDPYRERPVLRTRIEIPGKESSSMMASLPLPLRDDHADHAALTLADHIIGGGAGSRLSERLRDEEGISYSIGSWYWASDWQQRGDFGAWAMYAPQNEVRLLSAFQEELRKVVDQGFSEEEVRTAVSGWLQQRQVSRGRDAELARRLTLRGHEGRTLIWDAELEARVGELEAADLGRALARHIDPERMHLVRAGSFEGAREADPAPKP